MKTMLTIISIIAVLVWFGFLAGTTISFKPFSISMPNWMNMVGWVFLILAVIFLGLNERKKGYIEGYTEGSQYTIELVKKEFNKKDHARDTAEQ